MAYLIHASLPHSEKISAAELRQPRQRAPNCRSAAVPPIRGTGTDCGIRGGHGEHDGAISAYLAPLRKPATVKAEDVQTMDILTPVGNPLFPLPIREQT